MPKKIINLLGITSDEVPRFVSKEWVDVNDQSGGTYSTNKKLDLKHQC